MIEDARPERTITLQPDEFDLIITALDDQIHAWEEAISEQAFNAEDPGNTGPERRSAAQLVHFAREQRDKVHAVRTRLFSGELG